MNDPNDTTPHPVGVYLFCQPLPLGSWRLENHMQARLSTRTKPAVSCVAIMVFDILFLPGSNPSTSSDVVGLAALVIDMYSSPCSDRLRYLVPTWQPSYSACEV